MKIALIGNGPYASARATAVRAAGAPLAEHLPEATAVGVLQRQEAALDVAFVSGAAGRRVEVAEAALRQGRHVFLEWPPAASIAEAERLVARAEEAGAEVGVSRPLRFHPLFDRLPGGARARVVAVEARLAEEAGTAPAEAERWTLSVDAMLDLCCALVGSAGARNLDVQAARLGKARRLSLVAGGLRFHNGAHAQLRLCRTRRGQAPRRHAHVAGTDFHLEADLDGGTVWERFPDESPRSPLAPEAPPPLHRETTAFLEALRQGRPAPVSLLDVLPTLRLTERLLQQLR